MLKKGTPVVMVLALLLMSTGLASANGRDEGVLVCVSRLNTESISSFRISNLNDDATLNIDDVLVYGLNGTLLCEGPEENWEPFVRTELGPNEGSWFSSNILRGWCAEVPETGWAIVKIYWSTPDNKVFPLYGHTANVSDFSRSTLKCDNLQRQKK